MNPLINNKKDYNNITTFTLENVHVSVANAIRRVILSDIKIVVFKTTPYAENKSNFIKNTSRLNNEILKQRLSCIPIHIKDVDNENINNYIMELNVENNTENIMIVTTKDFKIKDKITNKYLNEDNLKKIFKPFVPPNSDAEYYIEFVYLRPKISDEIPGEIINLTCELTTSTAKDDSSFNVVSICSFDNTIDTIVQNEKLEIMKQKWKDNNMTEQEIEDEIVNWKLLEGKRYYKQNSFDFTIQSIGIFTNDELVLKACDIIISKINKLDNLIDEDNIKIISSVNTIQNSFDIILENEDYTIGNLLQFVLYSKLYEENKILSYCGFKKEHPHHNHSILRLAYFDNIDDKGKIKVDLKMANSIILDIFNKIKKNFD